MARSVSVRVPASSANLGPGFDSFGAALGLHVEVEVAERGRFTVLTDLDVARDARNLVVRGFGRVLDPGRFAFTITSDVPLSGGLGSSAAAYVAGLLAARELAGDEVDVLAEATTLEGHGDNVAAALLGGFVVCDPGPPVRATSFTAAEALEAVLVVPHEAVRTRQARAALPEAVPMADAVANVVHGALLVLGLTTGDRDLVARGLADRLHQPYRAHLYPRSAALVAGATGLGALGATISGAGPTVLLWCAPGTGDAVAAAVDGGDWAQVLRAPFVAQGAAVG